jgi:superfamily I DNA/RNA helicase
MAALRAGLRARIQGRDLATGLRVWIDSFNAPTTPELIRRAKVWAQGERQRLEGDDENDEQLAQVADKLETLEALAEGATSVQAVTGRLDLLFSDEGPGLVFSSVHRAKGLEWNRVFLLSWTFKPERSEEEENLWYVAITRTKRTLVLLTDPATPVKSPLVASAIRYATRPEAA